MFFKFIEYVYLKYDKNLAYYDALTGLLNRNYYDLHFKNKYKNEEFYLTIVDINNLKEINDTKGHHVGNERICHTSNLLSNVLSTSKVIRYGGDEFLVISNRNIVRELDRYKFIFSFGSSFKRSNENIDIVFEKADIEMYKMKSKRMQYKRR